MKIDLRSDTVTRPSENMLEAMMNAETGDDVFNEDPTVKKLEDMVSLMFGHEAGLFCPSGTMTNQVAIRTHTRPGDEVICDQTAHIYQYETGGMASNSGVQARLIAGLHGKISPAQVEEVIHPDFDWLPTTRLVSIENTANRAGGSIYTMQEMQDIKETCIRHGLKYHLDGARIFNALIETNDERKGVGKLFDSISICLSKGLGSPAGSVLIGSSVFIKQARRVRKAMGGGMRQVGILAAAGIYAIENNIERLKTDHIHAKAIEKALTEVDYVDSILPVQSNIIIFNLRKEKSMEVFTKALANHNIIIAPFGKQTIRMVTHMDIKNTMVETVIKVLKQI